MCILRACYILSVTHNETAAVDCDAAVMAALGARCCVALFAGLQEASDGGRKLLAARTGQQSLNAGLRKARIVLQTCVDRTGLICATDVVAMHDECDTSI